MTLDGRGHAIVALNSELGSDDAPVGIIVNSSGGLTNVSIQNIRLANWAVGISYVGVRDGSIRNATVAYNQVGIDLHRADTVTLTGSNVSVNTRTGIVVRDSTRVTVADSIAGRNGRPFGGTDAGIRLKSSRDVGLENLVVSSTTAQGHGFGVGVVLVALVVLVAVLVRRA